MSHVDRMQGRLILKIFGANHPHLQCVDCRHGLNDNDEIGCVSHPNANANVYILQVCVIPAFGVDMELSACL